MKPLISIKTYLILIITCCLLSCCHSSSSQNTKPKIENKFGYYGHMMLSHKGNCKNPIHYQNKITVIDTVEYQLIRK